MSRFSESLFGVIENQISPIAARLSSQRHVVAIKDGFISSMPFLIVGSFMLLFAHPPFGADSQWAFAQWWLGMVERHSAQIMMPYNMTMGIMAVYIAAAISYNLAISYKMKLYGGLSVAYGVSAGRSTAKQRRTAGQFTGRRRDLYSDPRQSLLN